MCLSKNSKTNESNLTKFHRKIKQNGRCVVHKSKVPRPKVKVTIRSKSCLSNNSKTTEANLTKVHRKIEYYETVCPAQELGSYAQGQSHNQVKIVS